MRALVVDYRMGNLRSVAKALEKVGFEVRVSSDPEQVKVAEVLVLPGVGAFKDAMENLKRLGLLKEVLRHIEKGKPYLGICLGLQLLFERSYEFGESQGMGVLQGEVRPLPPTLKVPHVGWNQANKKRNSPLLKDVEGEYFYFVHSYHAVPKKPEVVLTTTHYGVEFVSSVQEGNLFAVQFHPEKSQRAGLKLLENFKRELYG